MTPKTIVGAIERRLGVTGTPSQLRDAIELELLDNGCSAAAAAERAEQLLKKIELEIIKRRNEKDRLGEVAILHLRGPLNEVVSGSCYVFSDDPAEIKQSKLNRVLVDEIYNHIQALDFSQFERFGRGVLREIGCSTAKVTPHAGDQGIDFYGELSVGGILGAHNAIFRLMHETRMVLVGQAKHYPNSSIGPATVRELVGALSLSRTSTFSQDGLDLLSDVQLRPFSPVLALLFTTGDFTKGARTLAARAGLIAFSGWQLAVFLADRGVGLTGISTRPDFDPALFNTWLTST